MDQSETVYRGASRAIKSLRAWLPFATSPKTDLPINERQILVNRSRDAYKNHLIARAIINRLCGNVIGRGLRMRSNLSGPQFIGADPEALRQTESNIEYLFKSWAENPQECDVEGFSSFYCIQQALFKAALVSGDVFAIIISDNESVYGTKIQIIEADRVSTPIGTKLTAPIFDGIEKDNLGRTIAIHVTSAYQQDASDIKWTRVPVYDNLGRIQVIHVKGDQDRPGVPRGAPFIAPILESLLRIEQYISAELTATAINSMLTLFIERDMLPGMELELPQDSESNNIKLGNGAIVDLAPGEKIHMADPTRPVPGFGDFLSSMVRQIGSALDIPGDELLLSYDASYSAARATMLKAWQSYTIKRDTFAKQFCDKIYQLWLRNAVERGIIILPGFMEDSQRRMAYSKVRWIGPARGAVDELKEAQAAQLRIGIGVSSLAREAAAMSGDDWETIHEERVTEQRRRSADGLQDDPAGNVAPPVGDWSWMG